MAEKQLSVLEQLQFEQLQELLEKKRQKQEQEDQNKAVRKASAIEMQKKREQEIANQAMCPHMKEKNMGSAVVGTRDSNMVTIFMCQRCFKEWDASNIPPHLRPDPKLVGGVIAGFIG
jgi:DNA-directed RNA polymerase subunit M/transcription elongation factor TFIIS